MIRPHRSSPLLAAVLTVAACRVEQTITARVPDAAMEPTLAEGADVAAIPLAPGGFDEVSHGEIVLFRFPEDSSRQLVLRVAGLPGDTLEMRRGTLHRNGRPVDEPYAVSRVPGEDRPGEEFRWQRNFGVPGATASGDRAPSRDRWGPLVVPPGDYFMLGDNRDRSLDSRHWGFVADSLIVGRVVSPRSR